MHSSLPSKEASVFLRALYQFDATDVGLDSCMINCVLTVEANSCRRAFLLLEDVPEAVVNSTSSITTHIQAACNGTPSVNIEVNFQCCLPPTDCNFPESE